MFIKDGLAVNIYTPYTAPNGTQYHNLLDPGIRTFLGIEEIPDPQPPADYSEDFYYRTEQLTTPYVVYTRKSDEQIMTTLKSKFLQAVQGHLDTTAQLRGYDGILSACTYATSTNATFAGEGQACVNWRDTVWTYCYTELAKVEAQERPIPNLQDFLVELPDMVWPV